MKYFLPFALLLLAPEAQDPRARLDELQKRIALLGGGELRTDTDPAALAASMGHDLGKMFTFVRNLPFHPYPGVLRGAAGTLLAGAGNDADRCLLLKEMIQSGPAKPAVRFAFADLTDEQATTLAARALKSVPGLPGHRGVKPQDVLARVGATEESVDAAEARASKSAEAHLKRFDEGFAADRRAIEDALQAAGVSLAGSEGDGVAAVARTLKAHVWLQVQQKDGLWINLDPSFPEAAVEWTPNPVATTKEAIPEALHHRIALRLVAMRKEGAKLETDPIYAGSRTLSDLAGRAINVSVLPMGYDAAKASEPLVKLASGFTKFQPVIDFGGVKENGRVFDVQGRVFQSKDGKFGDDFGGAVGNRVFGAFGKKPSELAGAWMEVELTAPGRKPHTEIRYLLDRLAPAARAKGQAEIDPAWADDVRFRLALFQSWTIWPAPGTLNESFLFSRVARVLLRIPGLIDDTVSAKGAPAMGRLAEALDPLPLELVEIWQSALRLAQGAFAPGEGACYPAGASILAWKEQLAVGAKQDLRWRVGVDLMHAPLGCVAKVPAAAARARFLFGLLLSEGESSLMEGRPGTVFSAAVVFRKAREAKTPIVALKDGPAGATLTPRAAAFIPGELKAGRIVVIPRQPVEIGGRATTAWWRIDPVTGDCLGIGETGEGQGTSEGVLVLENISIPMVQRCMKFVVCLNMGIGAGRSMQDAGRECMTEFMREYIKDTVNGAIDHFVKNPLKKKAKERVKGGAAMMDPELVKMYEQAEETWGTVNEAIDDLTFSGLRAKVAILLDMGSEIAQYAHEKGRQGR